MFCKIFVKYLVDYQDIRRLTRIFGGLPWYSSPACPLNRNRRLLHRCSYVAWSYLRFLPQDWKYSDTNLWPPGNISFCCSAWVLQMILELQTLQGGRVKYIWAFLLTYLKKRVFMSYFREKTMWNIQSWITLKWDILCNFCLNPSWKSFQSTSNLEETVFTTTTSSEIIWQII